MRKWGDIIRLYDSYIVFKTRFFTIRVFFCTLNFRAYICNHSKGIPCSPCCIICTLT